MTRSSEVKNGGRAVVEDDCVVIRFPFSAFQVALDGATGMNFIDERWKVTDEAKFAEAFARALNDEDEQGTTPIHAMADGAFEWMINNGEEGVELHEDQTDKDYAPKDSPMPNHTSSEVLALQSLIEKVGKLTGPGREVDAEIALATGWRQEPHVDGNWRSPQGLFVGLPFFTKFIDAALTLVPEGFKWKVGYSRFVDHVAELRDYRDKPLLGTFIGESDHNRAIALCIASLKARLASLQGDK